MPVKLLFVCFGNICRSPIAHYVAQKKWSDSVCRSGGQYAHNNDRATLEAIEVARAYGVDMSSHRATPLRSIDLSQFDYVICLEQEVYHYLQGKVAAQKLLNWHVDDPYGEPLSTYAACAALIVEKIAHFEP